MVKAGVCTCPIRTESDRQPSKPAPPLRPIRVILGGGNAASLSPSQSEIAMALRCRERAPFCISIVSICIAKNSDAFFPRTTVKYFTDRPIGACYRPLYCKGHDPTRACGLIRDCRRPKTCTGTASHTAANSLSIRSHRRRGRATLASKFLLALGLFVTSQTVGFPSDRLAFARNPRA
jgi:hypothetical protein